MTPKRGLVFQAEIIEDDTLFFEDKFQTIPRWPRYKKKCVFMDPEGGAWTAPLAPWLHVGLQNGYIAHRQSKGFPLRGAP